MLTAHIGNIDNLTSVNIDFPAIVLLKLKGTKNENMGEMGKGKE
jgi:hypothetical protein